MARGGTYTFNFPLSRFAPANFPDYSRRGQADQITQEAAEAFSAAERGDPRAFLVELLDCVHACETAISEFDQREVDEAWDEVVRKNLDRGYYSGMADPAGGDPVEHPAHYERGGVQAVDVIEAVIEGLDAKSAARLYNVLKYALRADGKGEMETDLAKANNYAHRLCTGEWRWQHG